MSFTCTINRTTIAFLAFSFCSLFGVCLIGEGYSAYKYTVFLFCTLAIALHLRSFDLKPTLQRAQVLFFPWLPWLVGVLLLTIIYGPKGFSPYLNSLLLMGLTYVVADICKISRNTVYYLIAITNLALSVAICVQIQLYGLTNEVLFNNKNIVLGGVAILSSACFVVSLVTQQRIRAISFLSFISGIAAIVLAEVRTGLLAIFSLIPVVLIIKGKQSFKTVFILLAITAIALFILYLSGRLQQGLTDIEKFQQGNSNTSWGIRLEVWRVMFYGFLESPWLGWGPRPYKLIEAAGILPLSPISFSGHHPHNDLFNILGTGGLLGLVTWLITILLLFIKSLKDPVRLALLFAILAIGLSDCYWFDCRRVLTIFTVTWALLAVSSLSTGKNKNV